jgi:hypothetical protein
MSAQLGGATMNTTKALLGSETKGRRERDVLHVSKEVERHLYTVPSRGIRIRDFSLSEKMMKNEHQHHISMIARRYVKNPKIVKSR